MKVVDQTNGNIIAEKVYLADTFLKRFMGLMFKREIGIQQGIILFPCNSIHTCFMKISIDVLFLDKEKRVVFQREDIRPWHFITPVKGAKYVLEMPSGSLKQLGNLTGHTICLV